MSQNPSQDAPPSDSQPRRAYKPTRSLKPPAIQSAVLAKRANGSSKRQISKDLGVAFNTVTNILELNNFDANLDAERKESLSLIPLARAAVKARLEKNDGAIGIKVLENSIWPLNAKTSRQPDAGLTLAIGQLMGNVTVASTTELKPIESAAICVSTDTPKAEPAK
jgi:hypothetical protein